MWRSSEGVSMLVQEVVECLAKQARFGPVAGRRELGEAFQVGLAVVVALEDHLSSTWRATRTAGSRGGRPGSPGRHYFGTPSGAGSALRSGTLRLIRGVHGGPGSTVPVVLDEIAVNTLISVYAVAVDRRGAAVWPS